MPNGVLKRWVQDCYNDNWSVIIVPNTQNKFMVFKIINWQLRKTVKLYTAVM